MNRFFRCAIASFFALCASLYAFPCAGELMILEESNAIVYDMNGAVVGSTDAHTDTLTPFIDEDVSFLSAPYLHLSILDGVVLGQDNRILGVTKSFEGDKLSYWTTKEDRYYHLDSFCDEGSKSPITLEGAFLFDKIACPVCVNEIEPIFLGEHSLEWAHDCAPWAPASELEFSTAEAIQDGVPETYKRVAAGTAEKFDSAFADAIDAETRGSLSVQEYPDNYVRHFENASGGYTFSLIAPTQADLSAFSEAYGIGEHDDLSLSGIYINPLENTCMVLLWGDAPADAMTQHLNAIREELPLCVRLRYSNETTSGTKKE